MKWLLLAAEQNHVGAQYKLTDIYSCRDNIQYDISEAIKWYSLLAEGGHPEAQYELGKIYKYDEVEKNLDKSLHYFNMLIQSANRFYGSYFIRSSARHEIYKIREELRKEREEQYRLWKEQSDLDTICFEN